MIQLWCSMNQTPLRLSVCFPALQTPIWNIPRSALLLHGSSANSSSSCSSTRAATIETSSFSLAEILSTHSQNILTDRTHDLHIDRSRLWRQACTFYKSALHSPVCLSHKLSVSFNDEEGIDAGMIHLYWHHQCDNEVGWHFGEILEVVIVKLILINNECF